MKKIISTIIIMLGLFIGFSNVNIANANDVEEVKFSYSITGQNIEQIQAERSELFYKPDFRLMENPTKQEVEKYYYGQLTSKIARDVYNELEQDTTGIGKVTIELDNLKYSVEELEESYIRDSFDENISPYILDGYVAYMFDCHPNYWYTTDFGYEYTGIKDESDKTITFTSVSLEANLVEKQDYIAFNNKLEQVSNSITATSVYDIAKAANDYICANVEYQMIDDTTVEQTAYGALIKNQAVCEGQASLFTLLCRQKGLLCVNVYGFASEEETTIGHVWNYVFDPDVQKWYAVDPTWNNNGSGTNDYFMVGANTVINGERFSENHIEGVKLYEIQTYKPTSPTLSLDEYGIFAGNVSYSTTEPTKNNVIVTIKTNSTLQEVEGWTLSDDKKSLSKEYTANTEGIEIITLINTKGEILFLTISIDNIDKIKPEVTMDYTKNLEDGSVTVTIISNEELQELEGWNLSQDKKVLTKKYTQNAIETVIVKDLVGNEASLDININSIFNVTYSTKNPTNEDVTVTITSAEEMKAIEGWTLSQDKKTLTKVFTENDTENLEIENAQGKKSIVQVVVANIDKEEPILKVDYNITNPTNESVIANITSNEKLIQPEGWAISEDGLTISKEYTLNKTEEIEVSDLAGNTTTAQISIENIDKDAPKIEVEYSTQEKDVKEVVVKITSNEELQELDGWTLSEDKLTLTKTFTKNSVEQLKIKDLVGNITEKTIKVGNILEEMPKEDNGVGVISGSSDKTVANTILPYTGYQTIITLLIIILLVVVIVSYKKYKEYKKY